MIDTAARATLIQQEGDAETSVGLFTKEAFEALSLAWVRIGWSLKYYHTFTWFGLPVLPLPEDLLRLQEVIYAVRPAVILETGVFLGGLLLFHASLLAAMGGGEVIGIDREIQPHIREALCRHPLAPRISLLEGNSTDPAVVSPGWRARSEPRDPVLAGDSRFRITPANTWSVNSECYAPLVTKGSYIIATDGIMKDLADVPRAQAAWKTDNPFEAVKRVCRAASRGSGNNSPHGFLSTTAPLPKT